MINKDICAECDVVYVSYGAGWYGLCDRCWERIYVENKGVKLK